MDAEALTAYGLLDRNNIEDLAVEYDDLLDHVPQLLVLDDEQLEGLQFNSFFSQFQIFIVFSFVEEMSRNVICLAIESNCQLNNLASSLSKTRITLGSIIHYTTKNLLIVCYILLDDELLLLLYFLKTKIFHQELNSPYIYL